METAAPGKPGAGLTPRTHSHSTASTFPELVPQLLRGPVAGGDQKEAFRSQHPAERAHVLPPLLGGTVRTQAYGIQGAFVHADVEARQLCGEMQEVLHLDEERAEVRTTATPSPPGF